MQLETEDGDLVAAHTSRVQTQRRLRHETGPATYRLRIVSKGSRDLFDFEVVAELRKQAAPAKSPPRRARTKPAPAPGASTPPDIPLATTRPAPEKPKPDDALEAPLDEPIAGPQPTWVVAEVLDVEKSDGKLSAVMVEAGTPDGIRPGMQGELFEGETVIGRIEIVDVYPTGSRARIVGTLSAPVSFDTLSRIEIPPNGE
jgi:hypothetical protein